MDVAKGAYACAVTLMYLLSGVKKLFAPAGARRMLSDRLRGLPGARWAAAPAPAAVAIALAGLLQVVAPAVAVYGAASGAAAWRRPARWASWALAAFTVAATLLFHFPPVGAAYYPFMSNVTAFGALLLLAHVV